MSCCGSGSNKPKENYNENVEESAPNSIGKNILIWGTVIVLIVGLLAWLL